MPGGWTSPPHCELRTILQTDLFRYRFFRANGFYTLEPHKLIFYRTFAAQRFVRHICISKAGTFLSIHFSIFFSRNDISGQRFRGAEGESSPQSPPAGALLLKKRNSSECEHFCEIPSNISEKHFGNHFGETRNNIATFP